MKFDSQIILAFLAMGFAGISAAANSGSFGAQQQVVAVPPAAAPLAAAPLDSPQTGAPSDDDRPCNSARDCDGTQCCAINPANISGPGICSSQSPNCMTKHIIFKKDHVVVIHDEM